MICKCCGQFFPRFAPNATQICVETSRSAAMKFLLPREVMPQEGVMKNTVLRWA